MINTNRTGHLNIFNRATQYRLSSNEINDQSLNAIRQMIEHHKVFEYPRLERLQRYFMGEHDIRNRTFSDDSKPNNRLVHNFPSVITNQLTSFGFGSPVTYTSENNPDLLEVLKLINKENNEYSHNISIATSASIFGSSYELVFLEEESVRYVEIPPHETFMIYDTSLETKPIINVRYYTIDSFDGNSTEVIEIRTAFSTLIYETDERANRLTLISEQTNIFGILPVVRYLNNGEVLGDWENSIEQINAYNILQSDSINESEAHADAYLCISGMEDSEEEDFQNMRRRRVMLLNGEGAKAEWLVKHTDHQTSESLKTRVKEDIFNTSGTLDMNEIANTSHISGSAIRYKLLQTESLIKKKEQYFKVALCKRLEIITAFLNLRGATHNFKDIDIKINRNIPIDYQSVAEFASKVNGVISKETLFEQLEFVEDSSLELNRIRGERNEFAAQLNMYDNGVE